MPAHCNRIFNIGLNRAGTTSLTEALCLLGIRAVHHKHEGVRLYDIMRANVQARRPLLHGLDMYDAFSDFAGPRVLQAAGPPVSLQQVHPDDPGAGVLAGQPGAQGGQEPGQPGLSLLLQERWTGRAGRRTGPSTWPTWTATSRGGRAISWSSTSRRARAGRSSARSSGVPVPDLPFPFRNRLAPEAESSVA